MTIQVWYQKLTFIMCEPHWVKFFVNLLLHIFLGLYNQFNLFFEKNSEFFDK